MELRKVWNVVSVLFAVYIFFFCREAPEFGEL